MTEVRTIYQFKEYREFIRSRIEESRAIRGYQAQLADAAGCQRSYLSQVLNSHVHLTPDHAAGMCQYWRLDPEATEYFVALVHLARAASPHLKALLEKRLTELRRNHADLARRFEHAEKPAGNDELAYYSSWYFGAVHVLTSIPAFQTATAIAERLRLPPALVQSTLEYLEKAGLVETAPGRRWIMTKKDLHLARGSLLANLNHVQWRHRTIQRIQEGAEPAEIHYSGVHSLSRADYERIKDLVLDVIEKSRAIVAPSPEEEAVCFQCDLYRL